MSRYRLAAKLMIVPVMAGAIVMGVQSAASASESVPAGCSAETGGMEGSSWTWATCNTSASGIYFRAWIHCRHSDPYGHVSYYNRYSRWDWQGSSTGKLWAWCDSGDVYSGYNSAYGGAEVSN